MLEASLSKKGRKIVILTQDIDPETYNMKQTLHLAEFPLEPSESDVVESQDFHIESSDIEWSERDLKITHSYTIPEWSQDTVPTLPAGLPDAAVKFHSFRFPQKFSRHPVHFGSVYLCDDKLLAFETHESRRETHILDVTESQVSRCMPIRWRKPGDRLAISVLDTQTKKLVDYHLELPVTIPDINEYEVSGLDPSRGRLWISLKWDGSERKYFALQY